MVKATALISKSNGGSSNGDPVGLFRIFRSSHRAAAPILSAIDNALAVVPSGSVTLRYLLEFDGKKQG